MPIKPIPPREGKSPYWSGRGTHLGVYVDRSTKHTGKRQAKAIIEQWKRQIERGEFEGQRSHVTEPKRETTFSDAALAYLRADGDPKYLGVIIEHTGDHAIRDTPIKEIDQVMIDNLANALYPNAPATTRNRNFYTPVSAVLKRAGKETKIKRPKGWRGKKSQSWLEPEQAFPLIDHCYDIDEEFGLYCMTLLYTGERLSEPLRACLRHLNLKEALLYVPDTKNGEPRPVHLPPALIKAFRAMPPRPKRIGGRSQQDAGTPFLERSPNARLFRFHSGGHLRDMLTEAMNRTGLSFPPREGGFHIFCHTYGTWITRYGGLDTEGLVRTKRWKNAESAARYAHTATSYEARQSDRFPTPLNPTPLPVEKPWKRFAE
jgi:integrase